MKRLELFNALRLHRRLAEKRMIDLGKNKAAKWFMRIGTCFIFVYLMLLSITLAMAANASRTMSSIEFICAAIPIIFILDFSARFMVQQTPSQVIKPYVLLPIPKYTCVDFFIAGQMLNWSNLFWFTLLIPYCIMSVFFSYGLGAFLGILLFFWFLELCISQFYLIVRTLINDTLLWWIMPIILFIIAMIPGVNFAKLSYLTSNFNRFFDIEDFFSFYSGLGTGIEEGKPWPFLLILAVLFFLFLINRKIQYAHVITELSRVEKVTKIEGKDNIKLLDKLGELGLYLGLEIKMNLRNKNPRKSFIMGIAIIVLFSFIIIFTSVYDSSYMANFWCIYNYAIFGSITLVKVMCYEGNYIDGLMVRHENIYQILRSKYWFNCVILLIPFILMMPMVIAGKWSFYMVMSYGIFTAGFQFFLLFQLAVSNRTSQPLNTKFISKSGMENSKWQIIVEMFCLFIPVVFVSVLQAFLGDTVAYSVMFVVGILFILTHSLWLRNIYNRYMKCRYKNMEGFRATR
jgi:hypothetical protein